MPWLHDFLKSPSTIRPWLKLRMPTFSLNDDEIATVTKYFLALHRTELEPRVRRNPGGFTIVGGVCGAVIDARGRPLNLPKDDARRREMIKKWTLTLGG